MPTMSRIHFSIKTTTTFTHLFVLSIVFVFNNVCRARKWHPDRQKIDTKNNNIDEAKQKFQDIGEAYQVLSDHKLRAVYDAQGQAGLSGDRTEIAMDKVDPSLIFTFLFGNDSFQDIIGRLQLVSQTTMGMDEAAMPSSAARKALAELERRRVIRLAVALRQRIQKHVDSTIGYEQEAAARQEWTSEGQRLVNVRYGEEILNTVGKSYVLVAAQVLGNWKEGTEAGIAETKLKLQAQRNAMQQAQGMARQQSGEADSPAAASAGAGGDDDGDVLPNYIGMLWNVTVIDIVETIREVVLKVCNDKSVDEAIRKKRAMAIRALGEIWQDLKSTTTAESDGGDEQGGHHRGARSMYASAAAAAMEAALKKVQQEEEAQAAKQQHQQQQQQE
jgi:X-domain of DnaJ-containing/DnaJ domain